MNLNMIYKIALLLTLVSCGSAKIIPTTDTCTSKRHWKEHIYQVLINGEKINSRWYLEEDAKEIMKKLASENKCMSK